LLNSGTKSLDEFDLTTRGFFTEPQLLEDESDYKYKFKKGSSSFIGGVNNHHLSALLLRVREISPIHDNEPDVYDNISVIAKYFPESKVAFEYHMENTFGYGYDEDGEGYCDCCGKRINVTNTFNIYGLCDRCIEDHYATGDYDLSGNVSVEEWMDT